jgi:purine-cytosine permease-like protein
MKSIMKFQILNRAISGKNHHYHVFFVK